ncbi:hypothetical protein GLOIN_2v1790940 [Rhizophagus clarus]|uniref:Uncharacterized protein n=1 Tax=Rhizophagus clarus TaxID=94130 RepID=A0A8H3LVL5_9GLOM|nr:hypothetical protein GLOIN_2v1790940 [Rhizophagus clarus]
MRKRYIHSTGSSVKPFQIRNRFSHTSCNETTANSTEDNNEMLSEDIDMEDINRNDNESIYFQHYDNDIDLRIMEDYNEEEDYFNEEGEEEEGHNDDEEEESHNDHNDEEEEEGNNNENNDIHQIIEALDKDEIPSCDGEFSPYFNDYTTTALFCWLQKHNISTKAYEDLANIIHNPQFEPTHVRNYMACSQQSDADETYVFGPGIDSETKSEFWHGTLWGESPLFGQNEIIISEVIYRSGDFVYYNDNNGRRRLGRLRAILKNDNEDYQLRIQKILNYDDLPGNLKGLSRQRRSLVGEVCDYINNVSTPNISEDSLHITEVIYKCNDRWHIRDVKLSYQHPSDYISIRDPPSSMSVYKLFLNLYYDDFGTFRNVYHSLGWCLCTVWQHANTSKKTYQKTILFLGLFHLVANFDEFMLPFVSEMKELEKGNDLAGVLRHNANKGCRTCTIKKELWSSYNQDTVTTLRYHHITNEEILGNSQEPGNIKKRPTLYKVWF